jgi:hypothetical protein
MGAAVFAAPAPAAITPPGAAQAITTFPDSNIVIGEGLPAGDVDVQVLRGGTVIGEAAGVPAPGGVVEINHGPDVCWDNNSTPDIVAGDVIRILTGANDGIEMTVADVSLTGVTRGTDVVATGRTTAPAGALLVRLVKGAGGSHLEAPGAPNTSLTFDPADAAAYTATFTAPAAPGADVETRVVDGTAVTIAELVGTQACAQPVATNAMTALSRTTVNIANQGTPIAVSGVVQPGISVAVSVPGGPQRPATVGTGGAWTAAIPAGDLAGLGQGAHQITATFSGTDAPGPQSRTITKDTIAPAAPGATPGPGRYTTTQFVTLSGEGTVRWTNGAGVPSNAFTAPIGVASPQTLRAIAVDAAGNESGVAPFAYDIVPAPAGGGAAGGGAAGGGAGAAPVAPITIGASTTALSLKSLSVNSRMKRSTVRKQGVRLVMRLTEGTSALRIRVYRKKRNGTKSLLATGTRAPSAAGLYRTVLKDPRLRKNLTAGSYEVEVTPGTSTSNLGTPARYAFKVTGR